MKAPWRSVAWLLLPLAAALLAYLNTLPGEFVYDDNLQIVDNPWVHELRLLPRALTHTVWAFQTTQPRNYYRPVQMGLYALLWAASGGSPLPFHALNVLLHILVTGALFCLARSFSRDEAVAGAAALVFAVHPINTETVAWVACLPELTYTLFSLGALAVHIRSWSAGAGRRRALRFLAVTFFLLAAFSKETALTLLVLIPLLEIWVRPFLEGRPVRLLSKEGLRRAAGAWPYAIAACVYLAVRVAVVGGLAPMKRSDLTVADALINAPITLLRYFRLLVMPVPLLAHHVFEPLPSVFDPRFALGIAGVAVLVGLLVWLAPRAPEMAFALVLATVPFLPVLYLPAVAGAGFAERYAYLPAAGASCLCAGAIRAATMRFLRRERAGGAFLGILLLLASAGAAATVARNRVWHDDGRLATTTLADEPRAWHMSVILGNWYVRNHQLEEALRVYEEGARAFPSQPQLEAGAIHARLELHRISPEETIREYQPLAAAYPSLYEVQYNLGDAFLKASRAAEAEAAFRKALALNPNSARASEGLALALIAQGKTPPRMEAGQRDSQSPVPRSRNKIIEAVARIQAKQYDKAEALLHEALRLDPKSDRALLSLAVLESERGNDRAAIEDCRKALALDPRLGAAYQQLGVSALRLGDLTEAIQAFEKAVSLDPEDKEGFSRLGVAYAQAGRLADARRAFEKALVLDPSFEKARFNLQHLDEMEKRK